MATSRHERGAATRHPTTIGGRVSRVDLVSRRPRRPDDPPAL